MKNIIAALILSLQISGSPVAARDIDHVRADQDMQQRQRVLRDNNAPLDEDEKAFLKRLLEEKTLRYAKDVSDESTNERRNLAKDDSDPLAAAMRKSGLRKINDARKLAEEASEEPEDNRRLQYGGSYYNGGYYNGGFNGGYSDGYDYGYNGGGYSGPYNGDYYNGAYYNGGYENGAGGEGAVGAGSLVLGSGAAYRGRVGIPEKVSMVLEAFQDSRRIQDPIRLGPDSSYLNAGTQYLYNNEPLYNVVFDVPPGGSRGAYLINEQDKVAVVSGSCIRTDPKLQYIGRAYCQFDYRFLDGRGQVEASLSVEGPISKGDVHTLAITGGSGPFKRTVGTVVLESGRLRNGVPPVFIPDDQLDLPSSYMVKMFVFMDSVDLEMS